MSLSNNVHVLPAMKQRQIWGDSVILVPYSRHLVPKYNRWMQNDELQYLTGSEPLTLHEEYEMYESWTVDSAKCTFIVLNRKTFEASSQLLSEQREIESMVGDVNLYLLDRDDGPATAEIEIMIAESAARGQGFGREAALIMMKFGYELIGLKKFEAKIKINNHKSQRLFCDHFGFREISRSNVFEEITYENDLSIEGGQLRELFDITKIEYRLLNNK